MAYLNTSDDFSKDSLLYRNRPTVTNNMKICSRKKPPNASFSTKGSTEAIVENVEHSGSEGQILPCSANKLKSTELYVSKAYVDTEPMNIELLDNGKQHYSDEKDTEPEFIICQICQIDLSSMSPDMRNSHVNTCIDSGLTGDKQVKFEEKQLKAKQVEKKAETISEEQWKKVMDHGGSCPVCGEDVTPLDKSGRILHFNFCCDQKYRKAQVKRNRAHKSSSKEKILECPLCGQPLKTKNSRNVHMKACAKTNNVDSATLLARIKQQEEEHKFLGIANDVTTNDVTKNVASTSASNRGSRGRGRGRGNVSRDTMNDNARPSCADRLLKEQTDLALALSNSMAEFTHLPEDQDKCKSDSIPDRLKNAYEILMSPSMKPTAPTKRAKKKNKEQEVTPALIVETSEERTAKLMRKIEAIMLHSQSQSPVSSTPKLKSSVVSRRYKGGTDNKSKTLWHINNVEPKDEKPCEYYVSQITPPVEVCHVKIGSKISRMSKIAGWSSLQEKDVLDKTKYLETTMNELAFPMTQTAALLAQMASDVTIGTQNNITVTPQDMPPSYDDSPNKFETEESAEATEQETVPEKSSDVCGGSSGFMVTEADSKRNEAQVDANNQLIACFAQMVDNKDESDVLVLAAEEERVFAHKFVLKLRCPKLLEICQKGKVDLKRWSKGCVLQMLKFVYAADLSSIERNTAHQLSALASRLELSELMHYCNNIIGSIDQFSPESNQIQDDDKLNETADKTLQDLLNDLWGSENDESSSENDNTASQKSENGKAMFSVNETGDQGFNDEEYDDAFKVLTQQTHGKHNSESSIEENSEETGSTSEEEGKGNSDSELESDIDLEPNEKFKRRKSLNMTLHERMTLALLHGDESEQESNHSGKTSIESESEYLPDLENQEMENDVQHLSPGCAFSPELVFDMESSLITSENDENGTITSGRSESDSSCTYSPPQQSKTPGQLAEELDLRKRSTSKKTDEVSLKNDLTINRNSSQETFDNLTMYRTSLQDSSNAKTPSCQKGSASLMTPDLFDDSPDLSILSQRTFELSTGLTAKDKLNESNPKDLSNSAETDDDVIIQSQEYGNLYVDHGTDSPVLQCQNNIVNSPKKRNDSKKVVRSLFSLKSENAPHLVVSSSDDILSSDDKQLEELLSIPSPSYSGENELSVLSSQKRKREMYLSDDEDQHMGNISHKRLKVNLDDPNVTSGEISKSVSKSNQSLNSSVENSPEIGDCSISDQNYLKSVLPGTQTSDAQEQNERLHADANTIDLTHEDTKRISTVSPDLAQAESPEFPLDYEPDVWDGFEDAGFGEMCYENIASQTSSKSRPLNVSSTKSPASQKKLNPICKPETPSPKHEEKVTFEEIGDFDLGSSFSSLSQSQSKNSQIKGTKISPKKMSVTPNSKHTARSPGEAVQQNKFRFKSQKNKTKTNEIVIPEKENTDLQESPIPIPSTSFYRRTKTNITPTEKRTTRLTHALSPGTSSESDSISTSPHSKLCSKSKAPSQQEDKLNDSNKDKCNDGKEILINTEEEYDPPTDVSVCSGDEKLDSDSFSTKVSEFKTPKETSSKQRKGKQPSDWVPPSPFTPMPEFTALPTPQLQKEAARLGLRQFPKKRTIALLKNIWDSTHQYESDPEFDKEAIAEVKKHLPPNEDIETEIKKEPIKKAKAGKGKSKAKKSTGKTIEKSSVIADLNEYGMQSNASDGNSREQMKPITKRRSKNSQETKRKIKSQVMQSKELLAPKELAMADGSAHNDDSYEDTPLDDSIENSDREECLEETILQTSPSKKLSKRDVNFKRQQMWEFIQKNDEIMLKIFHYEPLEFDEFHTSLKNEGLTGIGMNIVSEFLDDNGIPYTMRKLRQDKPSWQKKRKPRVKASQQAK